MFIVTEYAALKGGYTCSSESTLVKMPHCWKSHVAAQYGPAHGISVLIALSSNEGSVEHAYCADSPEPLLLVYTMCGCKTKTQTNL